MSTQSKSFQRKILDGATRLGELHRLYWLVEIRWPLSQIKGGTSLEKEAKRYTNACHPERWVPAIPVAPDPKISRCWADILCDIFRSGYRGRGIEVSPALVDIESLAGFAWYEWGEELPDRDEVCESCGQINHGVLCDCQAPPTWALIGRHGHRIHISRHYGVVGLCGYQMTPQWVAATTIAERRAWPLPAMCSNCYRIYKRGKR